MLKYRIIFGSALIALIVSIGCSDPRQENVSREISTRYPYDPSIRNVGTMVFHLPSEGYTGPIEVRQQKGGATFPEGSETINLRVSSSGIVIVEDCSVLRDLRVEDALRGEVYLSPSGRIIEHYDTGTEGQIRVHSLASSEENGVCYRSYVGTKSAADRWAWQKYDEESRK